MDNNKTELSLDEMEDVSGGLSLGSIRRLIRTVTIIGKEALDTIKEIF